MVVRYSCILILRKFQSPCIMKIVRRTFSKCVSWKDVFTTKKDFGVYDIVRPGNVSEKLFIPEHIHPPPYVRNKADIYCKEPEIKTPEEIKGMRKSCSLARQVLMSLGELIQVGCTTDDIDRAAHSLCIKHNAYPSPLGYQGYPKSICTSVNNVACHGIPDDRCLQDGDIINIDVTVYFNGFHGDCSATFVVGFVDEKGCALVKATKECLSVAVSLCRPGESFSIIGAAIENIAWEYGFTVVRSFVGHGIGRYFHGPPYIYHYCNEYPGKMEAGMTFTIEPMLSQGDPQLVLLGDGWTAVTGDNSRTAQFEHTVLITPHGAEILT